MKPKSARSYLAMNNLAKQQETEAISKWKLNNSTMLIEWDALDNKQIEEAKKYYQQARKEGRLITDMDDTVISNFHPSLLGIKIKETELKDDEFAVRVIDDTGDRRLIWDSSDPSQVKEAVLLFDEYLKKGWRAYSVDGRGQRRRRIYSFDIEKLEVFFIEKTNQEIIQNFTDSIKDKVDVDVLLKSEKIAKFMKAFKDTKLIPRTYPG
jgi:hypothetical protein